MHVAFAYDSKHLFCADPPAGSTLNTFPDTAVFQCNVTIGNTTMANIQWYIDGLDITDGLFTEGYSITASTNGITLSVAPRDPVEMLPPSLNITCAPPGSPEAFYAIFTLISEPRTLLYWKPTIIVNYSPCSSTCRVAVSTGGG